MPDTRPYVWGQEYEGATPSKWIPRVGVHLNMRAFIPQETRPNNRHARAGNTPDELTCNPAPLALPSGARVWPIQLSTAAKSMSTFRDGSRSTPSVPCGRAKWPRQNGCQPPDPRAKSSSAGCTWPASQQTAVEAAVRVPTLSVDLNSKAAREPIQNGSGIDG